jgi:hypothetical protein
VSRVVFCGKARIFEEEGAVGDNVERDIVSTYLIICEHVPGIAR